MNILGFNIKNTQHDYAKTFEVLNKIINKNDEFVDLNTCNCFFLTCRSEEVLVNSDVTNYRFYRINSSKKSLVSDKINFVENSTYARSMCNFISSQIESINTKLNNDVNYYLMHNRTNILDNTRFVLLVDIKNVFNETEKEPPNIDFLSSIDILNIQYFVSAISALDAKFKNKIYLILKQNGKGDGNYFRCSDFLSQIFLADNNISIDTRNGKVADNIEALYNRIYFFDNKCRRLALDISNKSLSSYYELPPLLEVNSDTNNFFSQSVSDIYSNCWIWGEINELISFNMLKYRNEECYFDGRIDSEKLHNQILRAIPIRTLIDKGLITEENIDKVYELYKDMPFLSFFIFSYFIYDSKSLKLRTRIKEITEYIGMIQDISLGILQLMDNIVKHSEEGSGYFSFRLYNQDNMDLLLNKYNEIPYKNYLEIIINDCCLDIKQKSIGQLSFDDISKNKSSIMKEIFLKNLLYRINELENSAEKEQMNKFYTKFDYAELSDFFDPNSTCSNGIENARKFTINDWDDYYNITENTLYHYGLMQFTSIVKIYKGHFNVNSNRSFDFEKSCYYSSENKYDESNKKCIPGTQYSILLPIELGLNQVDTGIDLDNYDYDYSVISKYREIKVDFFSEFEQIINNIDTDTERIKSYSSILNQNYLSNTSEKKIYSFNFMIFEERLKQDILKMRELFIKSLLHYLMTFGSSKELHLCIYNCSDVVLFQIVELFCAFYNRFGICSTMKKKKIYLVGKDCRKDFLITGESLPIAIQYSEKECMIKGRFNHLHTALSQKIWTRYTLEPDSRLKMTKTIPYELIITPGSGNETIFEEAVIKTLNEDIQGIDMGCSVHDSHVMIGSKIHVLGTFYESEILFNYKRYIKGFSYLVCKIINEEIEKKNDNTKELILIGYENYSETLILSVKDNLLCSMNSTQEFNIETVICENIYNQKELNFRKDFNCANKNANLVIIVPINSTLSTQNKIIGSLKRDEAFKNIQEKNIIANIGVILVRDTSGNEMGLSTLEKKYWDEKATNIIKHTITTKKLFVSPFKFLVAVRTKWANPLECELCFPNELKLSSEKPLIGTNKASVVPMQLIGLKEDVTYLSENGERNKNIEFDKKHNTKDIEDLIKSENTSELNVDQSYISWKKQTNGTILKLVNENVLNSEIVKYGHSYYYDNHFQIFFNTDKLYKGITNKLSDSLEDWVRIIKAMIIGRKESIYNIVFIPEHSLNGEWTNYVLNSIFPENPGIISFDVMREYRDNFRAKYSNISGLYYNLSKIRKEAQINFHYLDGTINSGTAFSRAKSLIKSLFPQEAFSDNAVKVKVFKSVILLLSRCSDSTKMNYIEKERFYSFLEYSIPNMRNHGDACYLCKLENDFKLLNAMSATNRAATVWRFKQKKFEIKEWCDNKFANISNEKIRNRVSCTQEIFSMLSNMGLQQNDPKMVYQALSKIINYLIKKIESVKKTSTKIKHIEKLISYIQVISRPFLIYRKSFFEASLKLRIELTEEIMEGYEYSYQQKKVNSKKINVENKIEQIANIVNLDDTCLKNALIKVLLGSLAKNYSNYIIRGSIIKRIFNIEKFKNDKFILWYADSVKRLIVINKDESKSLWIEHLLIKSYEINNREKIYDIYKINRDLYLNLYIENTRIIYEGIKDLSKNKVYADVKSILTKSEDENQFYYLNNFISFMKLNYNAITDEVIKNVTGLINLYEKLEEKINPKLNENIKNGKNGLNDIKEYYNTLASIIKDTVSARNVLIIGTREKKDMLRHLKKDILNLFGSIDEIKDDEIKNFIAEKTLYQPYTIGECIKNLGEKGLDQKNIRDYKLEELECFEKFVSEKKITEYVNIGDTLFVNENIKTVIIKIEPNGVENSNKIEINIEPIYIMLDYEGMEVDNFLLMALRYGRNLLTFRKSFVNIMKADFNNGLMEAFRRQNDLADYLSTSNAAGHSTDVDIENMVVNLDASPTERIRAMGLGALADQFCGHLYNKYIREIDNGYLYGQLQERNGVKCIEELRRIFENTEFQSIESNWTLCSYTIVETESEINNARYFLRKSDLILIIALLIHNVLQHNKPDYYSLADRSCGKDIYNYCKIVISVNKEDDTYYFKVRNNTNDENDAKLINKSISNFPSRDEGITLWTINEMIKRKLLKENWDIIRQFEIGNIDKSKLMYAIDMIKKINKFCVEAKLVKKIILTKDDFEYLHKETKYRISQSKVRTGLELSFPFARVDEGVENEKDINNSV